MYSSNTELIIEIGVSRMTKLLRKVIENQAKYRIYCYGAGRMFEKCIKVFLKKIKINGVIDSDKNKHGKLYANDILCMSVEDVKQRDDVFIIIVAERISTCQSIKKRLLELGFNNFVFFYDMLEYIWLDRNNTMYKLIKTPTIHIKLSDPVKKISKKDITFVVSGKVDHEKKISTESGLRSIKKYFPESKIILSTWNGENVDVLNKYCDEVILLEEPQGEASINKQQFAVSSGLQKVKTKYAVRFRTDFELTDDRFLEFYYYWVNAFNKCDYRYKTFEQRVLCINKFIHNPELNNNAMTYLLSDCFLFGLTCDLSDIWDGYQAPDEIIRYFEKFNSEECYNPYEFTYKYASEQIFFIHYLKKKKLSIKVPKYYYDNSDYGMVEDFKRILASNIIIGNHDELGVVSKFDDISDIICYTHLDNVYQYMENIDKNNYECVAYVNEYNIKFGIDKNI